MRYHSYVVLFYSSQKKIFSTLNFLNTFKWKLFWLFSKVCRQKFFLVYWQNILNIEIEMPHKWCTIQITIGLEHSLCVHISMVCRTGATCDVKEICSSEVQTMKHSGNSFGPFLNLYISLTIIKSIFQSFASSRNFLLISLNVICKSMLTQYHDKRDSLHFPIKWMNTLFIWQNRRSVCFFFSFNKTGWFQKDNKFSNDTKSQMSLRTKNNRIHILDESLDQMCFISRR